MSAQQIAARLLKYNPSVNYGLMATVIGSALGVTAVAYSYNMKHPWTLACSQTQEWAAALTERNLHKEREAASEIEINPFRHMH